MNSTKSVAPGSSKAAPIQRKARGDSDKERKLQVALDQLKKQGLKAGLGKSGKLDKALAGGPDVQAPKSSPKQVTGKAGAAGKGPKNQAAAAQKSDKMAAEQVKAGAGQHKAKGGDGKPAKPQGKGAGAQKATKAAAGTKAAKQTAKAELAKAGAAKQQKAKVDAQKGGSKPGKETPGKALAKDGKAAEATKAAGAAKKADAQKGGKKPAEAKGKDEGKGKDKGKDKGKPGGEKAAQKADKAKPDKGGKKTGPPQGKSGTPPTKAAKPEDIKKTPGRALDKDVKAAVEASTGKDLSKVRVHEAKGAADAINAEAFTVGQDIGVAGGASKETLAHEAAHTAQNQEGGGGAPGSVSKPGDPAEKEADEVAKAALGSGGVDKPAKGAKKDPSETKAEDKQKSKEGAASAAKASQQGKKSSRKGKQVSRKAKPDAKVQRLAKPAAPVQRLAKPAADTQRAPQTQDGGEEAAKPVQFRVELGNSSFTIKIKGTETKKNAVVKTVPKNIAGLDGAKCKVKLSGGQPTGGALSGKLAIEGLGSKVVSWNIDSNGKVGGTCPVQYDLPDFARGTIELKLAGGGVRGNAKLDPKSLSVPKDCAVSEFNGAVMANGTTGRITGQGNGQATLGGGGLKGPINLKYDGEQATGQVIADIEVESFKKSFKNNTTGMGEPPKFTVKYENGQFSGDQAVPYNASGPGLEGQSTVNMKYDGGKFTGGGDGSFHIKDFIHGKVENTVAADGSVEGTFTIETDEFDIGPVKCESIKVAGGIKGGEINCDISGKLTAFDGRFVGTFKSDFVESKGMTWRGDLTAKIPGMKTAKVGIDYTIGQGYKGEGTLAPDIKGLDGQVKLKFDNKSWKTTGEIGINIPPVITGGKLKIDLNSKGELTGDTTLDVAAIKIPQCTISDSNIKASFGKEFKIGGTAKVTMAGGKASGTLTMEYTKGKPIKAGIDSQFSIPGLNPVNLKINLVGKKLSGSAKTTVNIPYAKQTELEVFYKDGKFSGQATVDFDIPFLKASQGKLTISPEGKLGGKLTITGKDLNIAPLKVENPTITGEIKEGKLSITGSGTVKGIPGCESAKLTVGMGQDQKFWGEIDSSLKIPGLKEAKLKLKLKDGKVTGSAKIAAEFKGATGTIDVKYDDGKFSGKGTLGYKKGKFDGKIQASLSEAGKLSGKGTVSYAITPNFKVIAELELRDDATMKIGGKIQAPKALDLFKKEFKKELVKFRLRFGVPGLSIQLPVVGVIGLEVQLSGGADIFAGLRAGLEDITVAGSFDTATDAVELDVGGKIVGEAWAGVGVNLKGSVNLGIGPAYIGGYLKARGEAKILGKIFAGAKAHYSSQTQDIVLDVDAGVSAGLQASLGISAGIHAGIDLWLKDINVEIIDKSLASWKYDLGKKLDYNPKFKYKLGGRAPSDQDLQPKDKPRISAKDLATKALKRLKG